MDIESLLTDLTTAVEKVKTALTKTNAASESIVHQVEAFLRERRVNLPVRIVCKIEGNDASSMVTSLAWQRRTRDRLFGVDVLVQHFPFRC